MTRNPTTDSWFNPTTGIGGPLDKLTNFVFASSYRIWDDWRLEELYEGDDIAGTIVDAVPDECFKRGVSVKIGTDDDKPQDGSQERVDDAHDKLQTRAKVQEAMKWARLFGGSAILLGADDGAPPYTELNEDRIRSVNFLTTFERRELQPISWVEDPMAPNFGEPVHYRVLPVTKNRTPLLYVHRSRLIIFHGVKTTRRRLEENQGFGSSVLLRAVKVISQFQGAFATALALMGDANQNVYGIKGLSQIIASGNEKLLETRLMFIEKFRSAINAIALDADGEQFIRSSLSLTGVHEILDKIMLRLSAAARMPVTVLMGQSPAGLSATGESDLRNWFAQILSEQNDVAKPAIERVTRLMLRAQSGPTGGKEPDNWSVQFPSLWEPTAREQAEIDNIHAQTDQTYFDMGVLKPPHIARARFRGDTGQDRPMLSDGDMDELRGLQTGGLPVGPSDSGVPLLDPAKLAPLVEQETTDDLTDEDVANLATKMTEFGIARCEHGGVNRCRMCGIERVRDFEVLNGEPQWVVKWRPIPS